MCKRNLCSKCETGKYHYELDQRSPMCPYISCYNKKKCAMYVKSEKTTILYALKKLFKKK